VADERERALDRAARLLARRDHSTSSLRAKLERAGVSEQERSDAIEVLAGAGDLDDARVAHSRAQQLPARGHGGEGVRADPNAQGAPAELAEHAVEALPPERERALQEARTLGGGLRAARALQRRGFSEDALERVLERTVADDP